MCRIRTLALIAVAGTLVAACGVRGGLEYPAEAKADSAATAHAAQGKPEGAARRPHKDFLLDGLIR